MFSANLKTEVTAILSKLEFALKVLPKGTVASQAMKDVASIQEHAQSSTEEKLKQALMMGKSKLFSLQIKQPSLKKEIAEWEAKTKMVEETTT